MCSEETALSSAVFFAYDNMTLHQLSELAQISYARTDKGLFVPSECLIHGSKIDTSDKQSE